MANRSSNPAQSQELVPYDSEEYRKNLAVVEERITVIMKDAEAYLEPIGINPKMFRQAAVTATLNNGQLMNADEKSFAAAVLKCAQRGLMPDGESAVLVAFNRTVTLIPMVNGMIDIVRRNIPGIGVESDVARTWEREWYSVTGGTNPVIVHRKVPPPDGLPPDELERGDSMIAAYCVVTLPPLVPGAAPIKESTNMWRAEIERIRRRARNSRAPTSPWVQHTRRMYEKTAIRAAFRRLPSRNQIFAAVDPVQLDDYPAPGSRTIRVDSEQAPETPVAGILPPAGLRI